jgi:hypothetical protein
VHFAQQLLILFLQFPPEASFFLQLDVELLIVIGVLLGGDVLLLQLHQRPLQDAPLGDCSALIDAARGKRLGVALGSEMDGGHFFPLHHACSQGGGQFGSLLLGL